MSVERVVRDLEIPSSLRDRKSIRDFVIGTWLTEEPGRKYRYNVASLADGRRAYLLRPARLNKGCDFQVWAEAWCGGKDKRPGHDDIQNQLRGYARARPDNKAALRTAVTSVFECLPPELALTGTLSTVVPPRPELERLDSLMHAIRWLFIEQDVTYWSGEGRAQPFHHYLEGLD